MTTQSRASNIVEPYLCSPTNLRDMNKDKFTFFPGMIQRLSDCHLFVRQVTTNILFVKETNLYFCSSKEATTNLFPKTVSTARRYETWPGINTVNVGGLSHQ